MWVRLILKDGRINVAEFSLTQEFLSGLGDGFMSKTCCGSMGIQFQIPRICLFLALRRQGQANPWDCGTVEPKWHTPSSVNISVSKNRREIIWGFTRQLWPLHTHVQMHLPVNTQTHRGTHRRTHKHIHTRAHTCTQRETKNKNISVLQLL